MMLREKECSNSGPVGGGLTIADQPGDKRGPPRFTFAALQQAETRLDIRLVSVLLTSSKKMPCLVLI